MDCLIINIVLVVVKLKVIQTWILESAKTVKCITSGVNRHETTVHLDPHFRIFETSFTVLHYS